MVLGWHPASRHVVHGDLGGGEGDEAGGDEAVVGLVLGMSSISILFRTVALTEADMKNSTTDTSLQDLFLTVRTV